MKCNKKNKSIPIWKKTRIRFFLNLRYFTQIHWTFVYNLNVIRFYTGLSHWTFCVFVIHIHQNRPDRIIDTKWRCRTDTRNKQHLQRSPVFNQYQLTSSLNKGLSECMWSPDITPRSLFDVEHPITELDHPPSPSPSSFPLLLPQCCYNNVLFSGKAFHYILECGCGDLSILPQEH